MPGTHPRHRRYHFDADPRPFAPMPAASIEALSRTETGARLLDEYDTTLGELTAALDEMAAARSLLDDARCRAYVAIARTALARAALDAHFGSGGAR